MADALFNNFTRAFVNIQENEDTILIPGSSSAATSDPDATTIEKEEENCPIFILPGVMGSNLYNENTISDNTGHIGTYKVKVWAPDTNEQFLDPLLSLRELDIRNELVTIGHDEQSALSQKEREYGALNWYSNLLDRVCSEFGQKSDYERDIYFYSYDWRQKNESNADKLLAFINEKGYDKVDLVCHSMGGLVASHFCLKARSRINKVVTLSTPYEGSPKLLYSLLTNKVLDDPLINEVLSLFGLSRKLKVNLPGPVELAPTTEYLNITPQYQSDVIYYGQNSGEKAAFGGKSISLITTADFQKVCKDSFPPYVEASTAQRKRSGIDGLVYVIGRNTALCSH